MTNMPKMFSSSNNFAFHYHYHYLKNQVNFEFREEHWPVAYMPKMFPSSNPVLATITTTTTRTRLILSTARGTGLWCTCLKVPNKVLVLCPLFIIQVDFEHRQEHWPVVYMPICSSISTVLVLCPLFRLILSTAKSTGLWCKCLYAQA